MTLTENQLALKKKIVDHLLVVKKEAYNQAIAAQEADLGEAAEANENEEGLYETGKVDQAINRVRAKSQVSDRLAAEIELLEGIIDHVKPTEKLQLGDVIHTNTGNFFVAVPADRFEIDGRHYHGISTESPFYAAAIGAKAGDTIELRGKSYQIKDIF